MPTEYLHRLQVEGAAEALERLHGHSELWHAQPWRSMYRLSVVEELEAGSLTSDTTTITSDQPRWLGGRGHVSRPDLQPRVHRRVRRRSRPPEKRRRRLRRGCPRRSARARLGRAGRRGVKRDTSDSYGSSCGFVGAVSLPHPVRPDRVIAPRRKQSPAWAASALLLLVRTGRVALAYGDARNQARGVAL
jgi:hypothetical protein